MLQEDLIKSGIPAERIISMRYTSEDFDDGLVTGLTLKLTLLFSSADILYQLPPFLFL